MIDTNHSSTLDVDELFAALKHDPEARKRAKEFEGLKGLLSSSKKKRQRSRSRSKSRSRKRRRGRSPSEGKV